MGAPQRPLGFAEPPPRPLRGRLAQPVVRLETRYEFGAGSNWLARLGLLPGRHSEQSVELLALPNAQLTP
jgi:hypothetical protein